MAYDGMKTHLCNRVGAERKDGAGGQSARIWTLTESDSDRSDDSTRVGEPAQIIGSLVQVLDAKGD